MNKLPLCPLTQTTLICGNFPSLIRARKTVLWVLVSIESLVWIQDLDHRRIVSLSALRFPMCLVAGIFAALICPVTLRGRREREIFLASLTFKDLSYGWMAIFVDWSPPVKWDWQLELQLEVEGAVPGAVQRWPGRGLSIWLCLILVLVSWLWKLPGTCCPFNLPGPSSNRSMSTAAII